MDEMTRRALAAAMLGSVLTTGFIAVVFLATM